MLWISRMVRVDCMQRTAELARAMHAPTWRHWAHAKHLLAYLKGTIDEKLVYKQDPSVTPATFGYTGYADSDFAPDYGSEFENYKSTTGWVFTINNVAFSWRSRKQTLLADSTAAAELMAATDASKHHSVWLRRLFSDLGFPQSGPSIIYEDNEGCKKLSRNYCGHDRVKHLDLRDMLVREHHQRGLTELVSVPTQFQLADPLTKTLAGPAVRNFRAWSLRGQLPPDCPAT